MKTVREVMTGTDQPQPQPFLGATISLTFDDGLDEHDDIARPVLAANGLPATFYVNSGNVADNQSQPEADRWMTWGEVANLGNLGYEIGGHGKHHEDLVGLSQAELEDQVCDDRADLIAEGALGGEQAPVSFAYPRGIHDQTVKDMVEECGYSSARWTEGLKWYTRTARCQLLTCPFGEEIHPPDPYRIRTVGSFGTVDLQDIERYKQTVRNLRDNGGGWIPLLFHEICPGPDPQTSGCPADSSSTTPERFTEFMQWIAAEEDAGRLRVRTVEEVMEGPAEPRAPVDTTNPVSQIRCDGVVCSSGVSPDPVSVTLSATDAGGSGLKEIRYTNDGTVPTGSSPIYTGPIPVTQTRTIRWRASDNHGNVEQLRSQLVQVAGPVDSQPPVSSIECSGAPCQAAAYPSAVSAHTRGDGHRRLGSEGDPLHDRRLAAHRPQPHLLGRDSGRPDHHDPVPRRGQRRQPRGAAVPDDPDRAARGGRPGGSRRGEAAAQAMQEAQEAQGEEGRERRQAEEEVQEAQAPLLASAR